MSWKRNLKKKDQEYIANCVPDQTKVYNRSLLLTKVCTTLSWERNLKKKDQEYIYQRILDPEAALFCYVWETRDCTLSSCF